MATAMARPMTAPTNVLLAWVPAAVAWPIRKSAVSMPSRMTAVKARIASPKMPPSTSARSTPACSVPLMLAEVRRIQNSIQVTTAAAMSIAKPSKICSAGSSKPPIVTNRTTPTAMLRATARPGAQPDLAEVPLVPGLCQIGEDDAHDERSLDALAKAGQQAGGEESEIQGMLSVIRW